MKNMSRYILLYMDEGRHQVAAGTDSNNQHS